MAEQWYAVVEKSTGRAISFGTKIASILPAEWEAIPISNQPGSEQVWDEATRSLIPRPPKVLIDRVDDVLAKPTVQTFISGLNSGQRNLFRAILIELLGNRRFRSDDEASDW